MFTNVRFASRAEAYRCWHRTVYYTGLSKCRPRCRNLTHVGLCEQKAKTARKMQRTRELLAELPPRSPVSSAASSRVHEALRIIAASLGTLPCSLNDALNMLNIANNGMPQLCLSALKSLTIRQTNKCVRITCWSIIRAASI